jgi:hypothetical protein
VRETETGEETEGDRLQKKKKEDERGEELLLHQEDNSMAQEVPREESKFGGLLHPAGSDRVVFKVPQERKSILGTCVVLLLSLSVRASSSFLLGSQIVTSGHRSF